jgi:protein O-mannosyl-transferase
VNETPRANEGSAWLRGWPWLHFALCVAALWIVYRGAFAGPFFSDDQDLILENPIVEGLSPAHWWAMFDPFGTQIALTGTYAPLHMLATALERALLGPEPGPWHGVNLALHAGASLLLASLFLASRIPPAASLLAAAVFALHPALVEGVAWISQLKTVLCGVFAFGALRALRERPGLASALFVAALLAKPHALFLLPTAAAFVYVWRREGAGPSWRWLGLWILLFAVYALPETLAFRDYSGFMSEDVGDPLLRLRSVFATAARYAWMAVTTQNVSAFAQPSPPGWGDPWWIAGLALCAALGARAFVRLRAGREEGAWWVFAAAGFAPVSQWAPFMFPIADRYLYFILPGLLGAALLALRGRVPTQLGVAVGCALVVAAGVRAHARADLWREPALLFLDSARHYPDGYPAQLLRARSAAQQGDAVTAAAALRAARERGLSDFMSLAEDPALAPIAGTPEFAAVIQEMARDFAAENRADDPKLDQATLHLLAHAQLLLGDTHEAARAFAAAIRASGLQDAVLRQELSALVASDASLREFAQPTP